MKRKLTLAAMLALLAALMLCGFALAEEVASGACGAGLRWTLDSDGALTISGSGDMTDFGYQGAPWYEYGGGIFTAVVEEGATGVGDYAFSGCEALTSVSLPAGVLRIGEHSFADCVSLTGVSIPEGVTVVGENTFSGCASLTSVSLPESLNTIGYAAFMGSGLTGLDIPGGVTVVGERAFADCRSLAQVELPLGLASIGRDAFSGCASLREAVVPAGVTSLEAGVFGGCTGLERVLFLGAPTAVADDAFAGCAPVMHCTEGTYLNARMAELGYETVTNILAGAFGSRAYYVLGPDGTMTIAGSGDLYEADGASAYPWHADRTAIRALVIEPGVTSLPPHAFSGCTALTSAAVPEGVGEIGDGAFSGCTALASVCVPDSVTRIGDGAFSGCGALTGVNLGGVTEIGASAFSGCGALADASFGEALTVIGEAAFKNCASIASAELSDGVTAVGDEAFSGCASLTSAALPEGLSRIGWRMFHGCESLEAVSLPASVTVIDDEAFAGCVSLEVGALPEGLTVIGGAAFSDCTFSVLSLPAGLQSVGDGAFSGCWIGELNLGSGAAEWGSRIFQSCMGFETVTLPGDMTAVPEGMFAYCDWLTAAVIPEGVTVIGAEAFLGSGLEELTIPDSVEEIGSLAFAECIFLDRITFAGADMPAEDVSFEGSDPVIVCLEGSEVEEWAVANRYEVEYLVVPITGRCGDNVTWTLLDGELTVSGTGGMWDTSACPWADHAGKVTRAVVEDGVTGIAAYCFKDNVNLAQVSLPDSVTVLGSRAFYNCPSLKAVDLPDGVAGMPEALFYGCSGLKEIVIPEGVTEIGQQAFSGCSALAEVQLPAGLTKLGAWCFYGCSSLKEIDIPDGVTEIRNYTFNECTGLQRVKLPEKLTRIGEMAFFMCDLTALNLPEGLQEIARDAFNSNVKLTELVFPSTLTKLGSNAFAGCAGIEGVVIPDGVATIELAAFGSCSSLKHVTLPDGLIAIGQSAFAYCERLEQITIPASVTSIGSCAFEGSSPELFFLSPDNSLTIASDACASGRPVVYCYEYSAADFWAAENGIQPVYIDGMDLTKARSVSIPERADMLLGETLTVSAFVFPRTAADGVVWTSSAPEIVSVDGGVLTALGIGEATVTAACGEVSASMTVTSRGELTGFELSETELMMISKTTAQLSVVNEQPEGVAGVYTWASVAESVATVDQNGLITAKAPGSTVITVMASNGLSQQCTVTVFYPVSAIAFDPARVEVAAGETVQLTANVSLRGVELVNRFVTFESSDESVATVDENGLLTALRVGEVTVTARSSNGMTASCAVTVHISSVLTLPDSLTVIEAEAFAGMSAEKVVLPAGVTGIGSRAFADCASLRTVVIPGETIAIADDAFDGCEGLTFVCAEGSKAAVWARANGFEVAAE